LHAVQREIALVGVRFREAARSPLGEIEALCVGRSYWQELDARRRR